ncbi:DUF3426 domain-containing protein [Psychrobacter ciconiae]|uniref:DUF3426 domain-containing protein n=1 Tax=Psychrobacter ciconiae TaxID=1553449 RepID=UPI0019187857|nr:DUF3426 domain-containing protein [Psychrobacter ciconiae]
MTSPIKTQCPYCQTIFDVARTTLDDSSAQTRCNRCQQSFLVNNHLVVPATNALQDTSTVVDSSAQNTADEDLLIHDDMELEETAEAVGDYRSLDDMDTWLNQLENQPAASESISKPTPSSAPSLSPSPTPDLLDTSLSQANDARNDHIKSESSSSNTDNAWLEDLLRAQAAESQPQAVHPDDPELTQLLSDMGMKTADANRLEKERQAKIAARLQLSDRPKPQSMATFLWGLGCLVLVLLLAAQYVIFNLDSLIKTPSYAAKLQSICAIAACSLPHADITAIEIDSAQIRASQVKPAKNFSDIQAELLNQSDVPQLLPNLKVSLYQNNTLMGEFIARPEDYALAYESQLGANHKKPIMFTVPLNKNYLQQVTIEPFY